MTLWQRFKVWLVPYTQEDVRSLRHKILRLHSLDLTPAERRAYERGEHLPRAHVERRPNRWW